MKNVIICDIDGTLADCTHRLPLIAGEKKDWDGFFGNMGEDEPRYTVIRFVNDLYWGPFRICLVTGRPERYRAATEEWLAKHDIRYESLHMRPDGDLRADDIVKQEILGRHFNSDEIAFVIDDRPRVIRMWREEGLFVVDVGNGEEF